MERRVIIICGPTASGKSDIAFFLAELLNTEIILADSRQIYKGLALGTAQPEPEKTDKIKYHLCGELDLSEEFNAARFVERATREIRRLHFENRIPIVEGGAGLYLTSLSDGIIDVPGNFTDTRKELKEILKLRGTQALYDILKQEDREASSTMLPQNWPRVLRALEIKRVTGKSILWFHKNQTSPVDFEILAYGIRRSREDLYGRINKRVERMITGGFLEEVRSALGKIDNAECNALNTVGYKEMRDHLEGKIEFHEAIELMKRNSRRYAKRQITWFNRDARINWIDASPDSSLKDYAHKILKELRLNE